MNKFKMVLMLASCLSLLSIEAAMSIEKETYFACESGFQFEAKKQAARCIKQERLSYKPPEFCSKRNNKKVKYKLSLDNRGKSDVCIPEVKGKGFAFAAKCPPGFQIQVRKGKDACSKGKPQQIKPVDRKVKR